MVRAQHRPGALARGELSRCARQEPTAPVTVVMLRTVRTADNSSANDTPTPRSISCHPSRTVAKQPRIRRRHKHDLRHYFASGLIAAGCDVVTVQRAMGHASATTTLSTYAHLWPTAEDKTRAAATEMAAAVLAARLPAQLEATRSRQ